jgi:hypothetical protein
VTFTEISTTILQPKCVSCHSSPTGLNDEQAFSTWSQTLNAVNTSDPASSLIYTETVSGRMPETGTALTPAQEAMILQWIQEGALDN